MTDAVQRETVVVDGVGPGVLRVVLDWPTGQTWGKQFLYHAIGDEGPWEAGEPVSLVCRDDAASVDGQRIFTVG